MRLPDFFEDARSLTPSGCEKSSTLDGMFISMQLHPLFPVLIPTNYHFFPQKSISFLSFLFFLYYQSYFIRNAQQKKNDDHYLYSLGFFLFPKSTSDDQLWWLDKVRLECVNWPISIQFDRDRIRSWYSSRIWDWYQSPFDYRSINSWVSCSFNRLHYGIKYQSSIWSRHLIETFSPIRNSLTWVKHYQ